MQLQLVTTFLMKKFLDCFPSFPSIVSSLLYLCVLRSCSVKSWTSLQAQNSRRLQEQLQFKNMTLEGFVSSWIQTLPAVCFCLDCRTKATGMDKVDVLYTSSSLYCAIWTHISEMYALAAAELFPAGDEASCCSSWENITCQPWAPRHPSSSSGIGSGLATSRWALVLSNIFLLLLQQLLLSNKLGKLVELLIPA